MNSWWNEYSKADKLTFAEDGGTINSKDLYPLPYIYYINFSVTLKKKLQLTIRMALIW